jgi:hypothetical protein
MSELKSLMADKYDMAIDKILEEMRMFPQRALDTIIVETLSSFDLQLDTKFIYHLLKSIFESWIDMDENYYDIVTAWTLGTYFFDVWMSYPFIFINAVKRSGKTRLLKLLSYLSNNGVYTMSLKEAVLFRLPSIRKCGLFIDETEAISGHEKTDLRELLNVAYKRGAKVFRMRRNPQTEKFEPEEFELFVPIATANITGLDDVLSDRCLSLYLKRSDNKSITDRVEFYERDRRIRLFKFIMASGSKEAQNASSVTLVRDACMKNYLSIIDYIDTSDTTYTSDTTDSSDVKLIQKNDITGRDLELWLPLFIVKSIFTEDITDLVSIASEYVKERRTTDIMDDRDTSMLIFLSNFMSGRDQREFVSYNEIVNAYNFSEGLDSRSKYAMNANVLVRILKRLKIIIEKRRTNTSREVRLDIDEMKKRIERMGISPDEVKTAPMDTSLEASAIRDVEPVETGWGSD